MIKTWIDLAAGTLALMPSLAMAQNDIEVIKRQIDHLEDAGMGASDTRESLNVTETDAAQTAASGALASHKSDLERCMVNSTQIRAFFEAQLAEQEALAMAHLGDSYWTDSYTGHNIGKDELAATQMLRAICDDPAAEGHDDPELFAQWLLQCLEVAASRYRSDHSDPDGYGIATIGMVERNLRRFCYA